MPSKGSKGTILVLNLSEHKFSKKSNTVKALLKAEHDYIWLGSRASSGQAL